MVSLVEATALGTAKKRQLFSGQGLLDAGVDSKRRRCEANDKIAKASANSAAPAATSSNLKLSEILCIGEQLSEEELSRGRKRWRAGSEPLDWDNTEWYLGNSVIASLEDGPNKSDSKSTTKVSTSAL